MGRRLTASGFSLPRRTFLRGAGATLALPLLEAMLNSHGTALAAGEELPRRMVVWFFGNGVRLNRFVPATTGTLALSEQLQPLADVKDYTNVVTGHSVKINRGQGHHTGTVAVLSGASYISLPAGGAPFNSKFSAPSIDQVMASRIGAKTTFPSLTLGISKRVLDGEGPTLRYVSHKGPDAPVEAERNPGAVYDRLFGNFTTPTAPNDPRNALRASTVDAVLADANRLKRKLGTTDRQRLDAHLGGLNDLRREIAALPPRQTAVCTKPTRPTVTNSDTGGREPIQAINDAMAKLTRYAFACDLTRVVSVHFSSASGYTSLPIGSTTDIHNLTHDANAQDLVNAAIIYTMARFATWATELKAQPEGDGNVLDRTALMCTSDTAEGLAHSVDDYPFVIVGKGSGMLRYPGVHFRQMGANTSNVLLSVMQTVDPTLLEVGVNGGLSRTPCAGIMA